MLANAVMDNTVWALRRAFKNNKAQIWRALEHEISSRRSNRREVNVGRLSVITKDGEVVVIPGKVLGSGMIDHKLTICTFSISEEAAKKILESGGKIITFNQLIEEYPDGKGVRIIG